jgi:(p)ppGpp synthase/HD superfamily hydrolase
MRATGLPDAIDKERQLRLRSLENEGAESESMLSAALAPFAGTALASRVRAAYEYAKTIEYEHAGLSPAAYLAHPVRVACMALQLVRPPDEDATVLALIHNVFEVSTVPEQEIARHFGDRFVHAMRTLTVDRCQTTRDYTVQYYRRVDTLPRWARVVKVLDKLDNLFILCLNPDDDVRTAYLADVEEFIVPMAAADLPHLVPYMRDLVANNRAVGFLETGTTH